jgi:hypothetical protein
LERWPPVRTPWGGLRQTAFRFFFDDFLLKKWNDFLLGRQYSTRVSLPPTGSLGRGGRFCGAPLFYWFYPLGLPRKWEPSSPDRAPAQADGADAYWLRKHTADKSLDGQACLAYFIGVNGVRLQYQ